MYIYKSIIENGLQPKNIHFVSLARMPRLERIYFTGKLLEKKIDDKKSEIVLKEEADKGNINNIDPVHFFLSMLSLIGFPFAMQHIMMGANNWTEEDFINFIKDREKMVTELCLDILKGENRSYII